MNILMAVASLTTISIVMSTDDTQAHLQEKPFALRLPVVLWRLWECAGVA